MSLMDTMMEGMILLEKHRVSDGEGGVVTQWTEGAHFDAALSFDLSTQARAAMTQGEISRYTVFTRRSMVLGYHDVFKRLSDGKIFRVTSDGDDKRTPPTAGLDLRAVSAEEWRLS